MFYRTLKKSGYIREYVRKALTFSKTNSTLSMAHNTIIICIYIVAALTVGSAMLEGLLPNTNWKDYIVNLMIGIDCSTLVVIVTSAMQFHFEQEKMAHEHNDRLFRFLFEIANYYHVSLLKKDSTGLKVTEARARCFDYTDYAFRLIYHNPTMKNRYDAVVKAMLPLVVEFTEHYEFSEIQQNLSIEDFNTIVATVSSFAQEYEPKDYNRFGVSVQS